ncbi:hypothetical protein KJS94_03060 [Flavihumibacter rivuli]|uniref:hypothetical protein n=1 Tax=Flavihumibacter rivuli TaxID=2838156 RepID=UPI001BDDD475|nr:hypothetical protein [Flavihumibacter rivuli]ULQ57177.1 hypothetical protein KJS94_03060 [Flavihumibacter rivuli]
MKSSLTCACLAVSVLAMTSCSKPETIPSSLAIQDGNLSSTTSRTVKPKVSIWKAEYLTDGQSEKEGKTIIFREPGRKKFAEGNFVPLDPRRAGRNYLTYAVDEQVTTDNGLSRQGVNHSIDRAMQTWNKVNCSKLQLLKSPAYSDMGYASYLFGFGGSPYNDADIQHAGFMDANFFDVLAPGGANYIIAVTFSFVYLDDNGMTTDINNDGLADIAFYETYYNERFDWATDNTIGVDIESIALHETGHSLGHHHAGKAFINKGKIHYAPRAVMNPVYGGTMRALTGTDNAAHCVIWAKWGN